MISSLAATKQFVIMEFRDTAEFLAVNACLMIHIHDAIEYSYDGHDAHIEDEKRWIISGIMVFRLFVIASVAVGELGGNDELKHRPYGVPAMSDDGIVDIKLT